MLHHAIGRRDLLAGLALGATVAFGATFGFAPAEAADIESVHFLIPGGAGGGWDGTARGVGEALTKAGLPGRARHRDRAPSGERPRA